MATLAARLGRLESQEITYEFELSVRRGDRDQFNDLYLLIEAGGGVFIPQRVKEAASAWQKFLTSAWL